MKGRAALLPGGRGFVAAVVAAQVLTQIGAFALPALLPGYSLVLPDLRPGGRGGPCHASPGDRQQRGCLREAEGAPSAFLTGRNAAARRVNLPRHPRRSSPARRRQESPPGDAVQ